MARKKYLEEDPDEDHDPNAENNITKNQKHQKNLQRHVLGNLALAAHHHNKSQSAGGLRNQGGLGGGTKCKNSGRTPSECPLVEDNYSSVEKQLQLTGLSIREMPGDGNCLFRALADQLEGHTRNHLDHRRAVVQYMRDNRPDFEPFVEDDEPFEKYVQTLSQPGTFAGNDAIVAFARLHNVNVVIHQLNYPAWVIRPTTEAESQDSPIGREVHIAYHNGDHYNSVRKIGDESDTPSNIKFFPSTGSKPKSGKVSPSQTSSRHPDQSQLPAPSLNINPFERDEDYWVKDDADIERLVDDVIAQTDYPDRSFVRETLIEFNFDMTSTLDFILSIYHLINQSTEPSGEEKGIEETEGVGVPEVVLKNAYEEEQSIPNNDENTKILNLTQLKPVNLLDSTALENSLDSDIVNMNEVVLTGSSHSQILGSSSFVNSNAKAKLSCRQKKEMKKRERKREADKRKKNENDNESCENSSPLASSTLGSLNI